MSIFYFAHLFVGSPLNTLDNGESFLFPDKLILSLLVMGRSNRQRKKSFNDEQKSKPAANSASSAIKEQNGSAISSLNNSAQNK